MEDYAKLRELAEKKGKYTAKEREYITKKAAENDVFLNTLCASCYKDAVIQLCLIYKPNEKQTRGAYVLQDGVNLILRGRNGNTYRVCAETLTDDLAREWIANGLNPKYFISVQ